MNPLVVSGSNLPLENLYLLVQFPLLLTDQVLVSKGTERFPFLL